MKPPASAIAALLDGSHADPFSLLGPHEGPEGTFARAILQQQPVLLPGLALLGLGVLALSLWPQPRWPAR